MANVSYVTPARIQDPECRRWLEEAIAAGKPGPEIQAIRAHVPGVMRSFTKTREWIYHSGVLDYELKELLRAYIALSADCGYCARQGTAASFDDRDKDELFDYEKSDRFDARQKVALRYADAIMWDPQSAATDEALWNELREHFSEPEIVELGYWVGFTFGGQRWIKTLGATQGELAEAIRRESVEVR
jgi:alkylhydroperoxidase family enzyme